MLDVSEVYSLRALDGRGRGGIIGVICRKQVRAPLLKVIAGKAKGRTLKVPRGAAVRPTSGLVRGAIFSMLESLGADWSRVLDLYAGSGALGIEALSRSAEWADFVDQDPRCCAAIRENLERTGLAKQARVYCVSVERALALLKEQYTLVFLDPPYADPSAVRVIEGLASSLLVGPGATLVVEHSRRLSLREEYGPFKLVRSRRHGDTEISIFQ